MPLYEYRCQGCGRTTEAMQSFSDPPLTTCESCGGELKKLLSAPAVQFKGSGWYVSDYARASQGTGEKKAEGDGKVDGTAKEPAKEDTKPATTGGTSAGGSAPAASGASPTGGSSS